MLTCWISGLLGGLGLDDFEQPALATRAAVREAVERIRVRIGWVQGMSAFNRVLAAADAAHPDLRAALPERREAPGDQPGAELDRRVLELAGRMPGAGFEQRLDDLESEYRAACLKADEDLNRSMPARPECRRAMLDWYRRLANIVGGKPGWPNVLAMTDPRLFIEMSGLLDGIPVLQSAGSGAGRQAEPC